MTRSILWSVLALLAMCCFGCATYKLGQQSFGSASEALNAQSQVLSQELAKITPTDKPVHGTALYLYPSDAEFHKNYVRHPSYTYLAGREGMDYLIGALNAQFQFVADAIQKRRIFDSVSRERHNGNPASYPMKHFDFLVFVDIDGHFIKCKDKPKVERVTYKPEGGPVEAFLDELTLKANALRGN
jgi:hypothetical protein